MFIKDIVKALEQWAPPSLQEPYDNCGLHTGDAENVCTGVLCTLDVTEEVVLEAVSAGANLVVSHHPVIFRPLKSLAGNGQISRILQLAIRHNISLYALHTSLDNIAGGVNRFLAIALGLEVSSLRVLRPLQNRLIKLKVYVPVNNAAKLRQALFDAGAGRIGLYHECSFNTDGEGTFLPMEGSNPAIGQAGGQRETVRETCVEVLLEDFKLGGVLQAMNQAHPYETVAYDAIPLKNTWLEGGSGLVGNLPEAIGQNEFLQSVKRVLGVGIIRTNSTTGQKIRSVAVCGGAGSFLIGDALKAGANAFITADLKYHDFFVPDGKMLIADGGHYETEQWCVAGIAGYLKVNFPTFAVLKTGLNTNPVQYR